MADGHGGPGGARGLNLFVLAVGKAGQSAEAELCARYAERVERHGRSLGISSFTLREVPDGTGPGRIAMEGERLLALNRAGPLVALDERGESLTSVAFAQRLTGAVEAGAPNLCFAIGGADGLAPPVRERADWTLSLSAMTLPHLLARAVLLEQLYRAMTIRLGHPYHRP